MVTGLLQFLFASLLVAQSPFSRIDPQDLALENREDGSVRYVIVTPQENSRVADPENSIVAVTRRYFSESRPGNLIQGRGYGVHADNLTLPVDSVMVEVNGETTRLERGALILANDGEMYLIENIYPDGRLAVHRAVVNPNSRNRVHGNFVAAVRENVYVIHVNDIRGTQRDCFFGYCKNGTYAEIQGVPICDRDVLVAYIEGWGMDEAPRMNCRLNGARIHGVFNDGTLVSGSNLFNPFPQSLNRYQFAEADQQVEP